MSFSDELRREAEGVKKEIENTFRAAALSLFRGIILSTPVDTGLLRGNWFPSGSQPSASETDTPDLSGNGAVTAATTFVLGERNWGEFTLTNNKPYAERIEFGYSRQAPAGMVRVNIARVEENLASRQ